jgi:hypothetical protein
MNNLKKINIVLIMIILIVCMFTDKTYAVINCNVSLNTSKDKVTYKEQFSVYVTISNLQTTKGIIAIGAMLNYDRDSLTLVDIKGENNWSDPFYEDSNGKLTSVKNKLSTNNENVFKIIFEVNENAKTESSAWIKINNFEISDGEEENNCGGNSVNVAIVEPDNESSDNDNEGSNSGNDNQGDNSGNINQGGNSGNINQGGTNQGSNIPSTKPSKPNTGTMSKPPVNISTNVQGEDLNNEDISNDSINNVDTNNIEEETSIDDENVIKNNNEYNMKPKESKRVIYIISIITITAIIGIVFLIRKIWRTN